MDEKAIRQRHGEIREALIKNEKEHEVLLSLLRDYESWLGLFASGDVAMPQLQFPMALRQSKRATKGAVSLRSAVLKALKDVGGAPLHSSEIWARVQAMGAATESREPVNMVDLTAHSLRKTGQVKKVGARTWCWVGEGGLVVGGEAGTRFEAAES